MSLNFIDIASWQAGLNLETMFAQNPLHGVVVKATDGTNYVNYPYCDQWVQWLIKNDKPWGFYHFLRTADPVEEAKYFVKHTINYFHDGVPAADYEDSYVANYGTAGLKKFLETVYAETGVKCLVYCNQSTIAADVGGFRSIVNDGYKLWLAQYTGLEQIGFREIPWRQGSVSPWEKETMHQYTEKGKLNGWSQYLDLDIFYGDRSDWDALAGKSDVKPEPTPDPGDEGKETLTKVYNLLGQARDLLGEYILNNHLS